jgi:hypothetical protein
MTGSSHLKSTCKTSVHEQEAFDTWLNLQRPYGDVDQVTDQWEKSLFRELWVADLEHTLCSLCAEKYYEIKAKDSI